MKRRTIVILLVLAGAFSFYFGFFTIELHKVYDEATPCFLILFIVSFTIFLLLCRIYVKTRAIENGPYNEQ